MHILCRVVLNFTSYVTWSLCEAKLENSLLKCVSDRLVVNHTLLVFILLIIDFANV